MIRYIGETLDEFPGTANQTRCFVHTVNLVAKSILKPFDTQKTTDMQAFNDVAQAIAEVTEDTGDNENDNNEEDKVRDEHKEPLDDEITMSLDPIRSMLEKVRLCFKAII